MNEVVVTQSVENKLDMVSNPQIEDRNSQFGESSDKRASTSVIQPKFRPPVRRPVADPKLKIVPLGGVEEIGINCTAYEYGNSVIVVDMGLGFSDVEYYGVDAIVPDIQYLERKKNKIKAILITHGHLDHIGALAYHLPLLDYPKLYATRFTIEVIKAKLEDEEILAKMKDKLIIIDEKTILNIDDFQVRFFHVNHSIPQCVGIYIKTPTTKVIHTGDFKFDNTPINEPVASYARIAEFGDEGIDILLSDSTNSLRKGHPISESEVAKNLEDVIEKAPGRVVVATFSGLVGRLYQLINIAQKLKRKVVITGYSMNQTLRIAQEIGYIKIPAGVMAKLNEVNNLPPDRVLILTTGAQGEPDAALYKMATEDYKGLQIRPKDTVVLSAKTIAGNDRAVQGLIDKITRKGGIVRQLEDMDFFTSGHGYQEDQKIMLNLVKPKFFMPVHGYQYFLRAHGETAKMVGVNEKNIIITQKGSVVEGNGKSGFKIVSKFDCEPLIVSGNIAGDVGATVIAEREQLANYGMIILTMIIDKDKKLIRAPFVLTRGFIYVRNNQELLTKVADIAQKAYEDTIKRTSEIQIVKDTITKNISDYVFEETGREPMIITLLSYLNS